MNGLALLGLILIVYAVAVVAITVKKPAAVWDIGKVQFYRKRLGEKGTVILFLVIAAIAAGFGIWLLVR